MWVTLCHYWELQTQEWAESSLRGRSWEGIKSIPRGSVYDCWLYRAPVHRLSRFMLERQRIIYNGPPSMPHLVAFKTCRARGVYYYPYPPWVPFYLDLHLEVGHAFAPFKDDQCDVKLPHYHTTFEQVRYTP